MLLTLKWSSCIVPDAVVEASLDCKMLQEMWRSAGRAASACQSTLQAVAAKVEQKVSAAAAEFAGRQQLFTHLADEIGWPLRIDDAQQRCDQTPCTSFL